MTSKRALWLVGLVVLAAVFARYWPYLFSGFWEDDFPFLETVAPFDLRALSEFFSPLRGWFYRPVFLVYFSLLRRVFGDNSVAFHAAGLVLHALNLTLLALLMRRLAGRSAIVNPAIAGALIGLLLYPGIAPTGTALGERSVSAVIWISSASTLLATLFSLLCLHCWLSFRRRGLKRFYVATWLTFGLALLSKEDAAALPIALLGLDFMFGQPRKWAERAREYAPFLIAFVLFAALDIIAYKQFQVFGSGELGGPFTLARYRLALQFYNRVLLDPWPRDAALMLAGTAAILVWSWRRDRSVAFFWIWLCASALPCPLMSGPHASAARFYYLPAFPAVAAFALMMRNIATSDERGAQPERALVPLAFLCGLIVLPLQIRYFGLYTDPAFVWLGMAFVMGIGWVLWRGGRWPGALFVALLISCIGSQLDIYGPDLHFYGPLLSLFVAVAALRGRRGALEALLALSLAWAQPVIYWLILALFTEVHRAIFGAFHRKMSPVGAPDG